MQLARGKGALFGSHMSVKFKRDKNVCLAFDTALLTTAEAPDTQMIWPRRMAAALAAPSSSIAGRTAAGPPGPG